MLEPAANGNSGTDEQLVTVSGTRAFSGQTASIVVGVLTADAPDQDTCNTDQQALLSVQGQQPLGTLTCASTGDPHIRQFDARLRTGKRLVDVYTPGGWAQRAPGCADWVPLAAHVLGSSHPPQSHAGRCRRPAAHAPTSCTAITTSTCAHAQQTRCPLRAGAQNPKTPTSSPLLSPCRLQASSTWCARPTSTSK
jgi:hypothetical protein